MSTGLPLMKNILTPLAKGVLTPLKLTATALAADETIQKKIYGLCKAALIISNKEMKNIMKKVKSFDESGLLIKSVCEKN